jgi:hypothetical protein
MPEGEFAVAMRPAIEGGVVDRHRAGGAIPGDPRALLGEERHELLDVGDVRHVEQATGSSVSSVAHRMGRTEFLLPDGVMVPLRGLPPLMMRSATGEVES